VSSDYEDTDHDPDPDIDQEPDLEPELEKDDEKDMDIEAEGEDDDPETEVDLDGDVEDLDMETNENDTEGDAYVETEQEMDTESAVGLPRESEMEETEDGEEPEDTDYDAFSLSKEEMEEPENAEEEEEDEKEKEEHIPSRLSPPTSVDEKKHVLGPASRVEIHPDHKQEGLTIAFRSSNMLELQLFSEASASLRKNMEWSKLEWLLTTPNSLEHMLNTLFPSSSQSTNISQQEKSNSPFIPPAATVPNKRKFSYYSKEEDNDRRIPFWPSDALDILRRIKDEDLHLLGLSPLSRPDWLIWQDFPVAPPQTRTAGTGNSDANSSKSRTTSDSTRQLNKIVTCVRTLRSRMKRVEVKLKEAIDKWKSGMPPAATATTTSTITPTTSKGKASSAKESTLESMILKFFDAYMSMMMMITQFIDSDAKHIPFGSQRPYKGVTTRMKKKDGLVRSNVNCKRVDYCARSVIIAAPVGLDINEIGLPLIQAMKLTKPVRFNSYNRFKLKQRILNGPDKHPGANSIIKKDGKVIDLSTGRKRRFQDLQDGEIVNCHLEDGDIVLVNRQPSLHGPSIMAHYVRVLPPFICPMMPIYAIALPLPVTKAYNADFDGDEMNLHVPQTEPAQAEAIELMLVQQMITTRACIGPVQDAVLAAYRFSSPDCFFKRDEMMQLVMQCKYLDHWIKEKAQESELPPPSIYVKDSKPPHRWIPMWTGKQVVSFLLPKHAHFHHYSEVTAVEMNKPSKHKHAPLSQVTEVQTNEPSEHKHPPPSFVYKTKGSPKETLMDVQEELAILNQYDDPSECYIQDGTFLYGRLRKVNFGTHPESLIQKCCLDFGPDYTMRLISDFQRIVAQLWCDRGFSMGIESEEKHIRKQTQDFIDAGLELVNVLSQKTKNVFLSFDETPPEEQEWKIKLMKCLLQLWVLQKKRQEEKVSPPGDTPSDLVLHWEKILRLFYRQSPIFQKQFFQSILNKITDVTGKRYLINISSQPESHMAEMVASGTKASTVHVMQITGILGSSRVQGKTVPRNYARERALPHFHPSDKHPSTFGYMKNGYETGLTPLEMYFNGLQGRESLANVVAQTPLLGYAQRRFLRNFEDITIAYDYTVRDPTGIVSFLDGDDGFSANHVEKQSYFCLKWDEKKIQERFHAGRETIFEQWFSRSTVQVQKECVTKKTQLKQLLDEEVTQIIQDVHRVRKMKSFYHPSPPLDTSIVTAVHFERTLYIHRSQMMDRLQTINMKEHKNNLSPFRIVEGIDWFKSRVMKTIQGRSSMLSFFALLHAHVSIRKVLLTFQLDAIQFELFLQDLEKRYLNSLAVPGYPNGTNASQVIGHNITQTSFDGPKTKASAGTSVAGGIQRINECTTASKKIKEPSMEIYLKKEYQTSKRIRELLKEIKMITLGQVVKSCHILYDPLPNQKMIIKKSAATVAPSADTTTPTTTSPPAVPVPVEIESNDRERKWNSEFAEMDRHLLSVSKPFLCLQENQRSRTQYHNYSSFVVRLELHREKLLELGKNVFDIVEKIQKDLLGGKHLWIVSAIFESRWVIRIRLNRKAIEFSKRVNNHKVTSRTEKQTVQCLVDILLTKITFNGLNLIKDVVVHETMVLKWDPVTLGLRSEKEYYLVTEGTNFQQVLNIPGVDYTRTISNDIHEVNQVFGIDSACNVLFREISKVLDNSKVHIDFHHLHVLKASIGKSGFFERCSRFGFGRNRKRGWMKRCSFEELVRNLKESALQAEVDELVDNASCSMIGKHVPLGTHGPFDLLEDISLSLMIQQDVPLSITPEVYPPITRQEVEGIVSILVPPWTPLQAWCQAGVNDNKMQMDFRWKRYEMGRERHIPDYSWLVKNPNAFSNEKDSRHVIPLPSFMKSISDKQPSLLLPRQDQIEMKTTPIHQTPITNLEPLRLCEEYMDLKEPLLQNNLRKKCQSFLFKRKKVKVKASTSLKLNESNKKRKHMT